MTMGCEYDMYTIGIDTRNVPVGNLAVQICTFASDPAQRLLRQRDVALVRKILGALHREQQSHSLRNAHHTTHSQYDPPVRVVTQKVSQQLRE